MKMNRHALSDTEWENIKDIAEYKPKAGPRPQNVRHRLDGICWILATGAPWRDMHPEIGDWEEVYSLFRIFVRRGIFGQLLARIQQNAVRAGNMRLELTCFDGTYIRAHRHAAGARKKKRR